LLYYLGWGLSAGLLAFVILVGALAIVVPGLTGSTPMTILTTSMTPTYPPGTLVIVRPVEPRDIRIGMPITYQLESGKAVFITHRVIAIAHTSDGAVSFTTRGDANGAADEKPVEPVQVRGEVWYSIPWLGWVNTFVGGENRGWIVPVIAGGLFLYAGYAVASSIASAAKRRRRAAAAEQVRAGEV
jgi:signal peptidase